MNKKIVYTFPNGVSAAFDGKKHIPLESWLGLLINELKKNGYNPEDFEFWMPDGSKCEVFKISASEYNWRRKL